MIFHAARAVHFTLLPWAFLIAAPVEGKKFAPWFREPT
jgi:hypothetical protein